MCSIQQRQALFAATLDGQAARGPSSALRLDSIELGIRASLGAVGIAHDDCDGAGICPCSPLLPASMRVGGSGCGEGCRC